jgi:hypothetical protein
VTSFRGRESLQKVLGLKVPAHATFGLPLRLPPQQKRIDRFVEFCHQARFVKCPSNIPASTLELAVRIELKSADDLLCTLGKRS